MNIHKITSDFSFDGLHLEEPKSLQGGSAYSVPIRYNSEILLVQTQTCTCKNGFVTNGRKTYIDLVFTQNDTYILNWIESLEEQLQKKIFEKSSEWFEQSLTEDDIESSFLSILKPQKNRTKYILRCYVHNLTNFNIGVKIYDEAGNDLATKDITPEVNIACILSLQDIKFSSKNFQVFINVKQIMVFRDLEKDRMLLLEKPDVSPHAPTLVQEPAALVPAAVPEPEPPVPAALVPEPAVPAEAPVLDNSLNHVSDIPFINPSCLEKTVDMKCADMKCVDMKCVDMNDMEELDMKCLDMEELDMNCLDINDTEELEMDELEGNNDTSKYIALYNEAREKAELAKKEALLAFLEVNNIKKKYNL
jgi:hypothetical protein